MNPYELVGTDHPKGSPTIRASRPGQEYQPRRDQVLAVMKDYFACYGREMTAADARLVCQRNHAEWRDRVRKWKWIRTDSGSFVQVEDK